VAATSAITVAKNHACPEDNRDTENATIGALPLGLVLTAHAVLHFNSGVFQWLSILTGAWALLCLVTIIDPAIRDKIDTARSLVATIHEARRI